MALEKDDKLVVGVNCHVPSVTGELEILGREDFQVKIGGNRIELVGNPAYTIKDPSFEPVRWAQDTLDSAIIWYGSPLPREFDTYGTPNYDPTEYRTANRHPRAHADDYIAAEASLLL